MSTEEEIKSSALDKVRGWGCKYSLVHSLTNSHV